MVSGDGPKLARVTYLPGVTPAPAQEGPSPQSDPTENAAGAVLPDFVSFFGEKVPAQSEDSTVSEVHAPTDDPESAARSGTRREVRAENVSMHALTRRGMSRWELEKTLLSREFDEDVVEAELDRLEGVGLLDDAALAETFVRTQHDRKGLGRGAITAELRRRHVDQEHIDAALEQVDDDDEQERATQLAIKRAGQLSSYDLETAKRRLHGFLSRKGYSSGVVRAAIDEALSPRSSGVRFR
ncbi:regulatory protein RecX [Glaciihabitans sp. INWT7]|uniref:regulatory protein RecX n=1 Tax=Glaciihabitans sp. INWT7 TaxID=2596912 RepID=UPI002102D993|nr:regulatory protein RecX [Glaciihabitans sp. INWT7]